MANKVDITGKQFGEWSVIEYAGDKTKHTYGNERAFVDITGQQFGVLKVIEYLGNSRWKCQCSCGEYVELLSKNIREHKNHKKV